MLSKKVRFVLIFVIMSVAEFISIGMGEIISVPFSLLFVITYIILMINALKDESKQKTKVKMISPQLRLKTKAPF